MSFDNRGSTMDGNGSNSGPQSQVNVPCKTGCGFYGNSMNEGLCSKCHKDKSKRLQDDKSSTSSSSARSASNTVQNDAKLLPLYLTPVAPGVELASSSSKNNAVQEASSGGMGAQLWEEGVVDNKAVSNSITERDSPPESTSFATSSVENKTPSSDVASPTVDSAEADTGKPKKNRCLECNKRVGLTGFGCRCGGLFCSTHRYSDKHNCQFDYKEHAQDQIRKNNPVVAGNKITKI